MTDHIAMLQELLADYGPLGFTAERAALDAAIRALSADRGEAVAWHSLSDLLPDVPGWYLGCNYGRVEPLRFDGNNWHHTRITRDLAMPSHWCSFDSIARPGATQPLSAERMEFVRMVGDEFGNDAGVRLRDLFAATPPSPAESAAPSGVSDAVVVAGARVLCQRHAAECNVDADDTWNIYSDSFKDDARATLEAALEAAQPQPGRVEGMDDDEEPCSFCLQRGCNGECGGDQ